MEAKELRIGNLLEHQNETCVVSLIQKTNDFIHSKGGVFFCNRLNGSYIGRNDREGFKPIPLTEDWLLKTQCKVNKTGLAKYFNYSLNDYTKVTLMMCNDKGKGEFYVMIHEEDEVVSIPRRMFFFHEWQNLFFALTGTELEIKQDVSACS